MLISQGSFRVCKNLYQSQYHNVILLILLTLLEKLVTLLNLLKKYQQLRKFHLGTCPGVTCAPYAYDSMCKMYGYPYMLYMYRCTYSTSRCASETLNSTVQTRRLSVSPDLKFQQKKLNIVTQPPQIIWVTDRLYIRVRLVLT